MTRLARTTLLATGLFAAALINGGCSSSTIGSNDLRADWTPELYSLTMSSEQYNNERSIHRNNTWRQVRDDWAMIWLEDRNIRLTRYTLP